ncbi:hypothetical protein [Shewanella phaeophyticola]|uniref:hypothetical protein n=1 Tax=Shewanella phaeophyticola TaxID=2978345 RepID=UPI0028F6D7D2|nr:hypothetical protein [Shewanella sp. KJ10-1]
MVKQLLSKISGRDGKFLPAPVYAVFATSACALLLSQAMMAMRSKQLKLKLVFAITPKVTTTACQVVTQLTAVQNNQIMSAGVIGSQAIAALANFILSIYSN